MMVASFGNIKLPLDTINSIFCSMPAIRFLKFNVADAAFVVISKGTPLMGKDSDRKSNFSMQIESCWKMERILNYYL